MKDVQFATQMIPHHQEAVAMAKQLLSTSSDSTLRAIANDIIETQPKEIAKLKEWLKSNGGDGAMNKLIRSRMKMD